MDPRAPRQPMQEHQLVVVGAGFAGLACAQAAAARGLDTAILERKCTPGERPRTTGILVKEAADAWDVPRSLTRKIHGVRLYAPGLKAIDLRSPGYYFLATDTSRLLDWLARRATAAGAVIRCSTPYRGLEPVASGVGYRLLPYGILAHYIVACDGATSAVARDAGLGRNRLFLTGTEYDLAGVKGVDEDHLHVFLDSRLAPGYIGWVVPGVGITQVGVAARHPGQGQLDRFLEKIGGLFDFSAARQVRRRGGLIPCGGLVRPFARDRLLALGDAAGMVSPLTAGGIQPALEVGRAAGVAISDFILDGGPNPAVVVERLAPSFLYKRLLRLLADVPIPNAIIDALFATPFFRPFAQAIFYHHRGLFSARLWKELVRFGIGSAARPARPSTDAAPGSPCR